MATAGNMISKSNFSSAILYTRNWSSDGALLSSGSKSYHRYVYFCASVFVWRCSRRDVWIGYGTDYYLLQYWNGSSWVSMHYQNNVSDNQTFNFEINITTTESASRGKFQTTCGWTWWRMRVNNDNYWPSYARSTLRIYGLGAHRDYDTRVKDKKIVGLYQSSQGNPITHSNSSTIDVVPSNSYVSNLYNETSLKGSPISAGIPEYAILPPNVA
ncbi:MAG: hypothetical protein WDA14_12160 [Sphaerochaetaceae bacterium]